MSIRIIARDLEGNPTRVHTDDGYCQTVRDYEPEKDGWIEDQLKPQDFSFVKAGREVEDLILEVNFLRKENFILKQELAMWRR